MAKKIMIQGTMSNVGKSLLVAGLCRVLHQDGYRVAPYKSQNMALNSFITKDGLEMGRSTAVQAEAAGTEPSVLMNPILLKPTTDVGSQVILNGEVYGNMRAVEYYRHKRDFVPEILKAFHKLEEQYDVIVLEGAGSAAEINLKQEDIVNMGMARMVDAPVLLVGDIDRGGVFAQLAGTVMLLDEVEKSLIKATIINKFRGDVSILEPGLVQLEELTGVPVAGVIPWLKVDIEEEDSLSERITNRRSGAIDIAVIRLPRISNYTDFAALEATEGVSVRYVENVRVLGEPDMIVIPGTKSTISDLLWMRENGLEAKIKQHAARGGLIVGICGGYQILGRSVTDTCGAEGGAGASGMGLLPIDTEFETEKHRTRVTGVSSDGYAVEGYEIHMGRSTLADGAAPYIRLDNGADDGCRSGNIYGTYLHGFFDTAECRSYFLDLICGRKGIDRGEFADFDYAAYKEEQFDILADAVRENLDMDLIYRILNGEV